MKIGIDRISFYVPKQYIKLDDLAKARNIDPLKFTKGLMQEEMSVIGPNEDIITMGANAAVQIIDDENRKDIDLVLFATESAFDASKSGATYLHSLLNLNAQSRAIELKQACYSATIALYFAINHIKLNPNKKVLIVTSDIAKYGLHKDGEPTQGAGATAMIVSRNPKILNVDMYDSVYTEDVYDFWRPVESEYALVDGKYSNQKYQELFINVFNSYIKHQRSSVNQFNAITFHIPYSKIGLKSLKLIANENDHKELFDNYNSSIVYNKQIGNIYTGSLFLNIISLLENASIKEDSLIGAYSYGSGAVAEFFTLQTVKGFRNYLNTENHRLLLNNRVNISIKEYEDLMLNKKGVNLTNGSLTKFILSDIIDNKRVYQKTT